MTKREFPFTGYGNKPSAIMVNDNTAPTIGKHDVPSYSYSWKIKALAQDSGLHFKGSLLLGSSPHGSLDSYKQD